MSVYKTLYKDGWVSAYDKFLPPASLSDYRKKGEGARGSPSWPKERSCSEESWNMGMPPPTPRKDQTRKDQPSSQKGPGQEGPYHPLSWHPMHYGLGTTSFTPPLPAPVQVDWPSTEKGSGTVVELGSALVSYHGSFPYFETDGWISWTQLELVKHDWKLFCVFQSVPLTCATVA